MNLDPYEKDEGNGEITIIEEFSNINIDDILNTVKHHGANILTEEEMAAYMAHMIAKESKRGGHYANLAEDISDQERDRLSTSIINWVDWDDDSRDDWQRREKKGIRLLGVSDKVEGGAAFEGASKVVHPLLMEAVVQFQSRAIAELFPPQGLVQTEILGGVTPEIEAQAKRVSDYMNYLYSEVMPGAFEEMDSMLFRLPLSGSCFKKIYYDPILEVPCSRFIEPSDFIVPYSAVDLETSPRFTHRIRENDNDIRKKIKIGYYWGDEYDGESLNESYDYPEVLDEIDNTEGRERIQIDNDERHTLLECYVNLDLEGFEDEDDKGNPTGIALPYIVTVDRDNQTILRIQRNYRPDDNKMVRTMYFAHYKFTPGYGFYGYGLLHMIGGLANSSTGALRALLDSAQFENQQGGFKSQDVKFEGGDVPIAPGEWRTVKGSVEELRNSFMPLPSKQPSQTLFNLLSYLDERAQRLASTTDEMVGDVPANMPVGTAMMNQENGSKVFSAIHQRLHKSQTKEFKILAALVKEYIPDEGYPFLIKGADAQIMAEDFDGRIDIIPTSSPHLISNSHRIAQAQSILDLATKFPAIINVKVAITRMLTALRVAGSDELLAVEANAGQEAAQQMEMQKLQLELQKLQIENEKRAAEIEKIKAESVNKNMEGMFSAISTAERAAMNPALMGVSDELLLSGGFEDKNGSPIAENPQIQIPSEEMPINTNPLTPVNPATGINKGIETGAVV